MTTRKLIGPRQDQVPSNAHLGDMAFQSKDSVKFTDGSGALSRFTINGYDAEIAGTAVDVFVYDTSRDSDGGAWRKRCQHTSWYNEELNTTTRGSRREFPSVAVIVAEDSKLTIYDGDDPSLPMWMVFNGFDYVISTFLGYAVNNTVSSATSLSINLGMMNGILSAGVVVLEGNGNETGYRQVNFLSDALILANGFNSLRLIRANGKTVADRNSNFINVSQIDLGAELVNRTVNDVAMTVLPNAPVDPTTGLPIPTIAVATASGVSVIKDDGTVVDSSDTSAMSTIGFFQNGDMFVRTTYSYDHILIIEDYSADGFSHAAKYTPTSTGNYDLFLGGQAGASIKSAAIGNNLALGENWVASFLALTNIYQNKSDYSNGMTNFITTAYNTGWMHGGIKGAFLSDTDDTDLSESDELVTNGTFDTDIDGWIDASASGGSIAWNASGYLDITNTTGNGVARQAITNLVVGQTYIFSIDNVGVDNAHYYLGTSLGGGQIKGVTTVNGGTTSTHSFVATSTYLSITVDERTTGDTCSVDNISVKLADADRSVNSKGLLINGTITRTPVATGADLVAYSGFSASNYLEQPYNSDLDFGTDDFCIMCWVKISDTTNNRVWFSRSNPTSYSANRIICKVDVGLAEIQLGSDAFNSTSIVGNGVWNFCVFTRKSGVLNCFVNGNLETLTANTLDLTDTTADISVGVLNYNKSLNFSTGSLALLRISATAPTAEQITKIYEDEKVLFQENAKATLYGTSDAITGLAYDDKTNLLHVGTSSGRSVFQGLRRIDNTTTAVGTAISAYDGLIVEE